MADFSNSTVVNDIVHGLVALPDYILKIINTKEFQRLRYVKQLGMCEFVYPSSGYSRFEHSIGTFHLASKLMKHLQSELLNDYKDYKDILTENDKKCVEIAALCHDIGHGCYSHFYEHAFDGKIQTKSHEDLSVEIMTDILKNINFDPEMIHLIGQIIKGSFDESIKENTKKKKYLLEIVANKKSGLDVDKFDYLCRDQIYLGWSNKNKIHDINRILHFTRVRKEVEPDSQNGSENWHLAIRDREIFHIHNIFYTRHLLHRYGYQHKTVMVVSSMFKKALKIIIDKNFEDFIKNVMGNEVTIKDNKVEMTGGKLIHVNDIWFSKEFISKVCDHHLWDLMRKHTSEIVENIEERKIYRHYCKFRVDPSDNSKKLEKKTLRRDIIEFQGTVKEKIKNPDSEILDSVIFELSTFDLQSEKGDPLLQIKFYKKGEMKSFNFTSFLPNTKAKDVEIPLPNMVKLIDSETIMIIFVYKSINEEDKKDLTKIKDKLCGKENIDKIPKNIDDKIVELLTKYTFTEINY